MSAHLNPLEGLAERWDSVATVDAAKRILVDLEQSGFDPSAELRLAGCSVADVYRRLL